MWSVGCRGGQRQPQRHARCECAPVFIGTKRAGITAKPCIMARACCCCWRARQSPDGLAAGLSAGWQNGARRGEVRGGRGATYASAGLERPQPRDEADTSHEQACGARAGHPAARESGARLWRRWAAGGGAVVTGRQLSHSAQARPSLGLACARAHAAPPGVGGWVAAAVMIRGATEIAASRGRVPQLPLGGTAAQLTAGDGRAVQEPAPQLLAVVPQARQEGSVCVRARSVWVHRSECAERARVELRARPVRQQQPARA